MALAEAMVRLSMSAVRNGHCRCLLLGLGHLLGHVWDLALLSWQDLALLSQVDL